MRAVSLPQGSLLHSPFPKILSGCKGKHWGKWPQFSADCLHWLLPLHLCSPHQISMSPSGLISYLQCPIHTWWPVLSDTCLGCCPETLATGPQPYGDPLGGFLALNFSYFYYLHWKHLETSGTLHAPQHKSWVLPLTLFLPNSSMAAISTLLQLPHVDLGMLSGSASFNSSKKQFLLCQFPFQPLWGSYHFPSSPIGDKFPGLLLMAEGCLEASL